MKQATAIVTFRGEPVEVTYQDMGHEPDCNAHVIEWGFSNLSMNIIRLTDEEEQSVYEQLLALGEVVDPKEEARWDEALASHEPDGWP